MAPPRAEGSCFEAPTRWGPLQLAVGSADDAAHHALDAAIVLHRCEPLLAALDDWCGEALAWDWVVTPAAALDATGQTLLRWRDGATRVTCPWAWLAPLAPPPAELRADLEWPAVAATIVAARLRLPPAAVGDMEPGGALLVPQSLLPAWHGVLKADCGAASDVSGAVVALTGLQGTSPSSPWLAPGFNAGAALLPHGDAGDALFEVRLDLPNAVPADRLLGWDDGPLGPAGPLATLWRCAEGRNPARLFAAGRLLPWGDGWALGIESLGA